MSRELRLRNSRYDVVAYDPAAGVARVNIDLHREALDQDKTPSSVLSGCRVINLTRNKEVPHRVFYTNDLQYEAEQVSWRPEEDDEYRIEISSDTETAAASMFPAVGAGEPLMLEEGPLDLGACHPHLSVADWDGDGRQDLLVGVAGEAGYIYFLRNTGDDDNPVFQAGVRLRADGTVIKAASENRKVGITQPWAGDWDDDGLLDLLVLCGAKGDDFESTITFYKNTGSAKDPILKDMGPLLNEREEPLVLSSGAPGFYNCFHPADWTRNGTNDILAVVPDDQFHGEKQLVLFENVGTSENPRFLENPVPITTKSGTRVSFRGLIDTFLPVDWLREGFTDILLATCMHYRTIFLYENAAKSTKESPILLDSAPSPRPRKEPAAPDEFQTDHPAPVLRLHNGEEARLSEVSPQISSVQAVRWGATSKRELIVATNEGYLCRFRNLSATDQKPALARPEIIRARSPSIFVGAFAVPACADWNDDGKPEIIVGGEWGELHYFENDGTLDNPLFVEKGKVRAGGEVIRYPGCYKQILENENGYSSPVAVDLDRDGLIDLVVSESRGYFNFYRNIGTPEKAAFDQGRRLYLGDEVLHSPWRVMPALFNNDGDDFTCMIAKEADGTFYLYTNCARDILTFTKAGSLKTESGQDVTDNMYGRTRIAVVDWDGDGIHDLILGTHGHRLIIEADRYRLETVGGGGEGAGLIRFENTGTNVERLYKLPQEMKIGDDILRRGMGHALNPCFTNWFGQEKNDMVLGTEDGRVYLYRRELLS